MAISMTCQSCHAVIRVNDGLAGKRARCPRCRTILAIPSAGADDKARVGNSKLQLHDILQAFDGEIEPIQTTWIYRFGIVCVTVGMVLLPLTYVALVIGVICGLCAYAVYGIVIVKNVHNIWGILLGYAGPLIAGAVLVFFMLKPLFAGRGARSRTHELQHREAPLLFALVARIAQAIGAPQPGRIELDCQVNASASFGSVLGGFLGSDLVLTIGFPLLTELTIQQFAGVIAHELGHFSQGAGMRWTYMIRSINNWFHRVVFERDQWDEALVRNSEESDSRLALILLVARLFVFLTRCLLGLLMLIGHALSCVLLRQMEYGADRFEARLAGSDTFAETSRRISLASVAQQFAFVQLLQFSMKDRVPDDFPALISESVQRLPAEQRRNLLQELSESKTGLLDTHPCFADRLASARKENAPGVFHLDGAAGRLVEDLPKLSQALTRSFYRDLFGKHLGMMAVMPLAGLRADHSQPSRSSL